MPKPIFLKPAGPSQRSWNNLHTDTDDGATCELCGTEWPKGEDISLGQFLNFQLVEECCGTVFDQFYKEIGEEFATVFVEDFAQNPTDPRFHLFVISLKRYLEQAQEKTSGMIASIKRVKKDLTTIEGGLDRL